MLIFVNCDTDFGERVKVWAVKGQKPMSIYLGRSVGSNKSIMEENRYFIDGISTGKDHSHNEVSSRVIVRFAKWNLRAGENNGLAEVFQHKRQSCSTCRSIVMQWYQSPFETSAAERV